MKTKKSFITIVSTLALVASLPFSTFADEKKDGGGDGKGKGQKPGAPKAASIFDAVDSNDDGKITAKELADSKRFQDSDKKEVGAAFAKKDANGDGVINRHEFIRSFGNAKGGPRNGERPKGRDGKGEKGEKCEKDGKGKGEKGKGGKGAGGKGAKGAGGKG